MEKGPWRKILSIFREIVQDCIDAGRLRAMDTDVMTQSLAVSGSGSCPDDNLQTKFSMGGPKFC